MKNNKPRVAATGIGAAIGTLMIWGFNNVVEGSKWVLEEPINLAVVSVITFAIGPLLREYERHTERRLNK